jgi:hypothetical protein
MHKALVLGLRLSIVTIFSVISINVWAQPGGGGWDLPREGRDRPQTTFVKQGTKCSNTPASFITYRDVVAADIKLEFYWYMNPENSGGNTYEDRLRNFNVAAKKLMTLHEEDRTKSYQNQVCHYRGEVKCPGNNKDYKATLTCHDGFEFVQSSLTKSDNKSWKSGPTWSATTLTWVTVGKKRGFTFAAVDAKRTATAIASEVASERNDIVKYVNKVMHIPLEID